MSKKKKKRDEWGNFIFRLFTRKRPNREFKIPNDYLLALADKIHRINPTRDIVYNTLKEVWCVCYDTAYQRCIDDFNYRKNKRNKHISDDFKKIKDEIDDKIHNKETNK